MLPNISNLQHSSSGQFLLIAGPCAIEGKEMAFEIATELVALSNEFEVPLIFKGSYKKANRTKKDSFTGIGDEKSAMLTERGTTFGYQDLIVDFRGIPEMQTFGSPVILDCTHSLQQPNQGTGVTGGKPAMIETIVKAGIAVGVNGLFIETHPEPAQAKSDGANMLPLDKFRKILTIATKIRKSII